MLGLVIVAALVELLLLDWYARRVPGRSPATIYEWEAVEGDWVPLPYEYYTDGEGTTAYLRSVDLAPLVTKEWTEYHVEIRNGIDTAGCHMTTVGHLPPVLSFAAVWQIAVPIKVEGRVTGRGRRRPIAEKEQLA